MIRSLYRVKLQRILCGGAFLLEQSLKKMTIPIDIVNAETEVMIDKNGRNNINH